MHYARAMQESFEREICRAAITCARIPTFEVRVVNLRFGLRVSPPLTFDIHSGRFKPSEAKDEGSASSLWYSL